MSARRGFTAVLRTQLRTGWLAPVVWVVALVGGYIATVAAIDGLYGTPEQLATYNETVASDPALAITRQPVIRAFYVTRLPTEPAAEETKTVSPGRSWPISNRPT